MPNVATYESSDEEENTVVKKEPKLKIERKWVKEATFRNSKESEKFLETEDCWGYGASSKTEEGKKVYYRCNKVKARGVQCNAKIFLLHDAFSTEIILYRAINVHNHDEICTKAKNALSDELKIKIEELWKLKLKPKMILEQIGGLPIQQPSARQLNNFLAQLNKDKFGSSTISLGEVESWCSANKDIPNDLDKPFVAGFEIVEEDGSIGNLFRYFVTTKRLLETATMSDKLHADATYKLIWQGFPVIVCGTTDLGRHFHHFGVSVCVNERQEDFAFVFKTLKTAVNSIYNFTLDFEVLISDAAGKNTSLTLLFSIFRY